MDGLEPGLHDAMHREAFPRLSNRGCMMRSSRHSRSSGMGTCCGFPANRGGSEPPIEAGHVPSRGERAPSANYRMGPRRLGRYLTSVLIPSPTRPLATPRTCSTATPRRHRRGRAAWREIGVRPSGDGVVVEDRAIFSCSSPSSPEPWHATRGAPRVEAQSLAAHSAALSRRVSRLVESPRCRPRRE